MKNKLQRNKTFPYLFFLTLTFCFQTSRYGILACLHWILIRNRKCVTDRKLKFVLMRCAFCRGVAPGTSLETVGSRLRPSKYPRWRVHLRLLLYLDLHRDSRGQSPGKLASDTNVVAAQRTSVNIASVLEAL